MNKAITKSLENIYEPIISRYRFFFKNSLPQGSYLFVGPKNAGKNFIVSLFSKILLCNNQSTTDCNCSDCSDIENYNHSDVVYIEVGGLCDLNDSKHKDHSKDGSRYIRICQIKRLNRLSNLSPNRSNIKVFIINNLKYLNIESANALLKTLEDAPISSVFLLLADETESVPDTISSRCQIITVNPMKKKQLESFLIDNYSTNKNFAHDLSVISRNRIERAIFLYENNDAIDILKDYYNDFHKLLISDINFRFDYADKLFTIFRKDNEIFFEILFCWEDWLRWHLYVKFEQSNTPSFFINNYNLELFQIVQGLNALNALKNDASKSINTHISIEVLMIDLPFINKNI
ncbi:MAG: hypothetical protein QMB22_04250 [Dehalococcoidia bacterium]